MGMYYTAVQAGGQTTHTHAQEEAELLDYITESQVADLSSSMGEFLNNTYIMLSRIPLSLRFLTKLFLLWLHSQAGNSPAVARQPQATIQAYIEPS